VLPFADMSPEKDQAYFCEGIAEEILGALSKVEGLRVASRTSSFRLQPGAHDAREAGRRLLVRSLLEGSVRKSAARVRISVHLTDAESGYQLWAERFDREMENIFALQEEIANSVAQALEVQLSPKDKAALRATPTKQVQAYDYYLQGRKYYYGYGPRDIEFAIKLFTAATGVDAEYALAYAGLADCWSYIYLYAERASGVREQAEWASAKAVELAPDSAQAQASRALALSLNERDAEAEAAFEAALRLDPALFEAHYYFARHCFVRGQLEKATEYYEGAMRIRPEDYQSPLLSAQIYDDLGRSSTAKACRERGIRLVEEHLRLNPDDVRATYMAANGMAALGQKERGREWAERALALRPDDSMVLYNAGCIYSMTGHLEKAIACLERAHANGLTQKGWYENDSNLTPLRKDPRFTELLRKMS